MGAWGCANAESDFSSMLRPSRTHGVSGALQKHFLNFNQGGALCVEITLYVDYSENQDLILKYEFDYLIWVVFEVTCQALVKGMSEIIAKVDKRCLQLNFFVGFRHWYNHKCEAHWQGLVRLSNTTKIWWKWA